MALDETRKHYRAEALETAAELIRQHGGTDAMDHLPEAEQVIFDEECKKLADALDKKALKYRV
ncbi:hypothetical protein [Rheinheimera sp.]|uniref:hypothetical protein n=1 Tax=Rheinheimera sp. TaxID=1869214 RepID=UPI00404814FD